MLLTSSARRTASRPLPEGDHSVGHERDNDESEDKRVRNKLTLWVILLLAGFLAGFIPQYLSARRVPCRTLQHA